MTPQNQLSVEGNFLEHPLAELLAEIRHAGLEGSLRTEQKDKKCVFYFRKGRIVLAVSNAREARLLGILQERSRLTSEDLGLVAKIGNDFELAAALERNGTIDKNERTELFQEQIKRILIDVLTWNSGTWCFNALARLRDGLTIDIKVEPLLADYARCISADAALGRFRTVSESFSRTASPDLSLMLKPEESAVIAIFRDELLTTREVIAASALSAASTIHALYSLWLSGILTRHDWTPAFSDRTVEQMLNAKLELRQEARRPEAAPAPAPKPVAAAVPDQTENGSAPVEVKLSVEDYLDRVESAETYYDMLGIEPEAAFDEIKKAYFTIAKSFHPDHFHQEESDVLRRVQVAFTAVTSAHETLRDEKTRETYNFKVRKMLEDRQNGKPAETIDEVSRSLDQALASFERGFSLLMEGDFESSLPFLARAVHFDPNNARFHAYFGKALSFDESKRHKAESEMQTALRFDPQNTTYRIMLAEFFIQMKLYKRAEGELNRLLSVFPSNREARDLLDSLKIRTKV